MMPMNNFIQIDFHDLEPEQQELLFAHLVEAGYEGFVQEDSFGEENAHDLKAFITEKNFDKELLNEIAYKYQLSYDEQIIPEQNWNAVWESNFQPVIVDDFVHGTPWAAIRAEFHSPVAGVEHEIVITPKMSFGTGHHATTYMMIRQMREINFAGKAVFDFGTGTGVLAILAEKLGAKNILAIDNDDRSIANAAENIERNSCSRIKLEKAGNLLADEQFDIILANINRNVILDNFSSLVKKLSPGGIILLSGLMIEDEADILAEAGKFPLIFNGKTTDKGWICLRFIH